MEKHNLKFSTEDEEIKRLQHYKRHDDHINEHNKNKHAKNAKYELEHNEFSHLSEEEFK